MVDINVSDSDSSSTPTETTTKRFSSPDPPQPPEKSSHQVASRRPEGSAPEATRQHRTYDDVTRVLVVGRSGSGKTYIIQTLGHNDERRQAGRLREATKEPRSELVSLGGHIIELIDTPGFDNIDMSDVEIFTKITHYLREPHRIKVGVTGIIYVHRAGDAIQSRSLRQNLKVLIDVFLQEVGTSRLTVLESQLGVQRVGDTSLHNEMSQRSAFDRVWTLGAKISPYPNQLGFIEILRMHVSQTPITLPIQLDGPHSDFTGRIEQALGYHEQESVQELLRTQEHDLREAYEARLSQQLESESQLRQQLKDSELGYSSLRSQLQLQENVEQSQVVQALNDLNRMIDDIGRSISAYLYDSYVTCPPGRDPSSVTALDAVDLPALKALLDHVDGRSSIIMSSKGKGMQIECFFDFAIRHMVCRHLTREIFRPFHPGIHPNLSRVLDRTREKIQNQSPQVIAGKWRSETFKNIYPDDQAERERHINAQLDKLLNDKLKPLSRHVFGKDVDFTEDHHNCLHHLLKMAWDWNSKLKGEVIMLGDFVQTSFPSHFQFTPTLMEEFEPNPRNPGPLFILGTLALGLLTRRAVGEGNMVEKTTVVKAIVLTHNAFV